MQLSLVISFRSYVAIDQDGIQTCSFGLFILLESWEHPVNPHITVLYIFFQFVFKLMYILNTQTVVLVHVVYHLLCCKNKLQNLILLYFKKLSTSIKSFRVIIIPRIRAVPPNGPVHSECRGKIMLVQLWLLKIYDKFWRQVGNYPHYLPNFYLLTDYCKKQNHCKIKYKNHNVWYFLYKFVTLLVYLIS